MALALPYIVIEYTAHLLSPSLGGVNAFAHPHVLKVLTLTKQVGYCMPKFETKESGVPLHSTYLSRVSPEAMKERMCPCFA